MPLRILIVDDTPEIRLLMRVALQEDGRFEVVGEAADGSEAVEMASREKPDAILLDLAMPVMDGLQAIPKIRENSPDSKIVVLTAFDAPRMLDETMAAGAHDYIEKGAEIEEIADRIVAACES